MLPQPDGSSHRTSFVENVHSERKDAGRWATNNASSKWHGVFPKTPEKALGVSTYTARQKHETPTHFKNTDPEKRLEEMLAFNSNHHQLPHTRPVHGDVDSGMTTLQWRPSEYHDASVRRFGFHNDARVNSSDSGLFTAVENDEDFVSEKILDHNNYKPNSFGQPHSSYQFTDRANINSAYTYMNERDSNNFHQSKVVPSPTNPITYKGDTKSQQIPNNTQQNFKDQGNMHPNYEAVFPSVQRQHIWKTPVALIKAPTSQKEIVKQPYVPSNGTQPHGENHPMYSNNTTPKPPQSEIGVIQDIQGFHPEEISHQHHLNQQNRHRYRTSSHLESFQSYVHDLPKEGNTKIKQYQHQPIGQIYEQSQHHQEPSRCVQHHQNMAIPPASQYYQQQQAKPERPQILHQGQEYTDRKHEVTTQKQNTQSQPYLQNRHQFELQNQQPHAAPPQQIQRHISPENDQAFHDPNYNKHIENPSIQHGGSNATFVRQLSTTDMSSSSEKDSFKDNPSGRSKHPLSKEESVRSSTFLQEKLVEKDSVTSVNIRVRRRTKRVSSKAKKPAESHIQLSPEQYCFEDFKSSDSDTESLGHSQRSHLTWVRGGAGRYSDRAILGGSLHPPGPSFLSTHPSNFTRSFLMGNHVFGDGHSLSARSLGGRQRASVTKFNNSHGGPKLTEPHTVPEPFSTKPRKEFYEPITEPDSGQSGLSFSVVPGLLPDTSILVSRKEALNISKRDILDDATTATLAPQVSSSYSDQLVSNEENENSENTEGIYENCTSPESSTSFNLKTSKSPENSKNNSDYEDDSTVYESIHPQSLCGDNEQMDSDFENDRHLSVSSIGLPFGYQHVRNEKLNDKDGYLKDEEHDTCRSVGYLEQFAKSEKY
ncbi:hypothetical protein ElyMa_001896400 [Elysia marginata]|uniref:Uncharacterized protein n=1 Tax=Elysia marginata TaxID=1093978 RepID=A0AAV4ESK5_9GAST|nr:hypothetical protein ElyMa_001896400 [Elysia marginata]